MREGNHTFIKIFHILRLRGILIAELLNGAGKRMGLSMAFDQTADIGVRRTWR